MLSKLEQSLNAPYPILVTLSEIITLTIDLQPSKAAFFISVIPFGIISSVNNFPSRYRLCA